MPQQFDLTVLVASLDSSPELEARLELLRWMSARRPEIRTNLVAGSGGDQTNRARSLTKVDLANAAPAGRAAGLARRAHASAVAAKLRSLALRRHVGSTTGAVLVDGSSLPMVNWLASSAGPVVATFHHRGSSPDELTEQARQALSSRVQTSFDGHDLLSQGSEPDDDPDPVTRWRADLHRRHHAGPEGRWLVMGAAPGQIIPADDDLALVWQLLGRCPSLRVVWLTEPCGPTAIEAVERHLRDAGLAGMVEAAERSETSWRTLAGSDAVVTVDAGFGGSSVAAVAAQVARQVTVAWRVDQHSVAEVAELLGPLLADRCPAADLTQAWHSAVFGPRLLQALGLEPGAAPSAGR